MIFRIITLVLFYTSMLSASSHIYEMMPGKYSMKLLLTDSQESYPVSLSFDINDLGKIYKGSVDYPTYNCKAYLKSSIQKNLEITTKEIMIKGFDACNSSTFTIQINKRNFFSPKKKNYFNLRMYDGEENAKVQINSYLYKPTAYGKYKIKNHIRNLDEILSSKSSSLLRKYIPLASDKVLKKRAQNNLHKLVNIENKKYANIKKSKKIKDYEQYIATYPGSTHVNQAKITIARIKKEQLIATYRNKNTPDSYYKAYKLSNEEYDIKSILSFMIDLKLLNNFFSNKPHLKSHYLVKNKFIMFYRKKDSLEGYKNAYNLSKDSKDISSILKHSNSILELEYFLKTYTNNSYIDSAKEKLIKLYRQQNNFKGYLLAYKLLSKKSDGEKALDKAHSSLEKAKLEKAVFDNIKSKESLVNSSISSVGASYSEDEFSGTMFSKYSLYAMIYPEGKVGVEFINFLPYTPKFGIYQVVVEISCIVPRQEQLRSNWLGNKDAKKDVKTTSSVVLTLKPPYKKVSEVFHGKKTDFVYFNRGSAGGFTAKWPSENAYFKIQSIGVYMDHFVTKVDADLNIDFDKVSAFRKNISYPTKSISKSYSKGLSIINRFSKVDTNRENSSSNYSSAESSPQEQSNSTASKKSRNSTGSTRGAKSIKSNGKVSGVASYRINCTGGSDYIIYYKNGTWNKGLDGNMGMKFKNYSKEKVASYLCK